MLTRTRPGWSIDSATPERCAASAAAASDWMARAPPMADGAVSATSASEPPRIHSDTTRPPDPVCATSRTRATPGTSMRLSRIVRDRISASSSSGSTASGSMNVSATWRSRAVSMACQNCRCGRAAVEHQQAVAAAGDRGAGDQVDVVVAGGRFDGRFVRHAVGQRLAGGVAAVVRRRATRRGQGAIRRARPGWKSSTFWRGMRVVAPPASEPGAELPAGFVGHRWSSSDTRLRQPLPEVAPRQAGTF